MRESITCTLDDAAYLALKICKLFLEVIRIFIKTRISIHVHKGKLGRNWSLSQNRSFKVNLVHKEVTALLSLGASALVYRRCRRRRGLIFRYKSPQDKSRYEVVLLL